MSNPSRLLVAIVTLALSSTLVGRAHAAPSASIEQVRNGLPTASTTPTPAWVTGNAGGSNSHYLESHSIAYRTVMKDLPTDGTVVELVVAYNVKRSGSYAIDYLTHYQRLLPHVGFSHSQAETFDPLAGVSGVGPTVTTTPIPIPTVNLVLDPDGADSEPAAPQPATNMSALSGSERLFTLFGGTLIDASYVTEGDVALATSSSESQMKIRFTATSPTAVLAWGGHIACRWDWGFNADGSPRSAGGISGSSYHMRLVGWNLGSVGNQDRSMSTDAVYPVPRCGISNTGPLCAGATVTHTAPSGMETYVWTLFDNTSGAAIVGSNMGPSVTVSTGAGGSYGLLLTTGASGFSKQCQAIVLVNVPVTADAGADQTVCATSPQVQLAGVATGGTGSWTGGGGTWTPNASSASATYTPSAAEITAGGVTLTFWNTPTGPCAPVSDAMRITIERAATANAGADFSVCATNPQMQLAGSVGGGATSGAWSGGTGSFSPNASAMNAVYTPSAAEIAAGSVMLTLTTNATGGPCPTVNDAVTITILPAATANAGADRDVCAASPQVQLAGSVGGGATSGTWSGGTGRFSPNASALNATYTPSAGEIAAGGVTLTLTTNDPAGPCVATSDAVRITIEPAATVNAGADLSVCSTSPQAQLAGNLGGGASSGTWNGGAGSFSPGRSALNAVYTPSAAEIAAGSVTLTLTTNATGGPCPTASDAVTINILPAATANAGADRDVCATSPQVQLAGSVGGGASSGMWSGGAGSFSPGVSALNATYTPSAAEIAAGAVTLTLTTNDPAGPCGAVTDQMRIRIMPIAIVNAGPDFDVCSSSPRANLQGSVSGGASTGVWSGGTGTFSPSASVLNASYTPSAAEIAAGSVTLTLTSTGNQAPCPPASDQVTILISPAVSVNAGPDQIVCPVPAQVRLAGVLGNGATSGTWTGGAGAFVPNASTLDAMYTLSAAEVAAGGVTLTLTTNDPAGPCPPVQDAMRITVSLPRVTVANRTVCEGISPVQMCANASNGVGPYTYLWSNGATTACISAADTGSYTVTITDAKGCQATATGVFRQRECTGMIAHTNVTCTSFMDGTGEPLWGDVHWVVQNNVINSISPGVFFYFTKIDAPSSDFVVNIVQTKDNPSFPFCEVQQAQVSLYGADCGNRDDDASTGGGQASVHITGATPGQVFIISVKYSLKSLVGTYMDETMGCHYDFRTEIAGQVVDADPHGIQVGVPRPVVEPPLGGNDPGVDPGETITLHDRPTEPAAPAQPGQNPPPGGSGEDDTETEAIQRDRPTEPPSTPTSPGGGGGAVSTPVGGGSTSAPGGAETFGRAVTESPGAALVLDRPMPNPFNGSMSLAYAVSEDGGAVEIAVYDLAGRRTRTLVSGRGIAGTHRVTWDGRDDSGARVRKGMYFVHVRVGQQARQVRVTFVN